MSWIELDLREHASIGIVLLISLLLAIHLRNKTVDRDRNLRHIKDIPVQRHQAEEKSTSTWGFSDSGFSLDGRNIVTMRGSRYGICGVELPFMVPLVASVFGVDFSALGSIRPAQATYPTPIVSLPYEDIGLATDQISKDSLVRQRHGHGHTLAEMYDIKYSTHGTRRIPDVVVYPSSTNEVSRVMTFAAAHNAVVLPFGGGTNVTQALACPPDEARAIMSVDMSRMNTILWLDEFDCMACVQAGAVGLHLEDALQNLGWTTGHEPDSMEFSTLGGWIATRASGMKKNRYGNIEDIVLSVEFVTSAGVVSRQAANPRESIGSDVDRLILGSEGSLAIITSAILRIRRVPEAKEYGSYVFPSFEDGTGFMYDISQSDSIPASVRLVDTDQFQLSHAIRPAEVGLKSYVAAAKKTMLRHVYGFDLNAIAACTLLFEGSQADVARQRRAVHAIARRHGGVSGGAESGMRGYQLTYAIAYLRDFLLPHNIAAESFETSVPWSKAAELCARVKARVRTEHAKRGLPGKPHISARLTQVYPTGIAIYFYFATVIKGVENPVEIYEEIERCAREEILDCGGALSHHHGVGRIRRSFLPKILSPASIELRRKNKAAWDPMHLFTDNM
ncbi:alkyl-dihydroxyacetonephosphate synthase [Mycena epipterygia]|nr:alkyl-dihydroxyacetonephosphate synthase [Mycena epipterygia]